MTAVTPLLNVLIPTFNRSDLLARVLRAYDRQDVAPGRFDVVVVDDGSSDGTAALLAGWRPERYRMSFVSQKNGGPARARNTAIRMSRAPLVLFTGDDIVPSPSLVRAHLEAHAREPGRELALLGLSVWPSDLIRTNTMRHVDGPGAEQFSYAHFAPGAEYDFRHFYTSNISLKRSLLDCEPTYFATDFEKAAFEDIELGYRLSLHGMRIVYDPRPRGEHYHPYEVRSFFRRQTGCGAMARVFYDKRPQLRKWFGTPELEWARLEMLEDFPDERERLDAVSEDISLWEERVLRIASFYDVDPEFSALDDLLSALFRYAYLKGLAGASYPPGDARRLCARVFLQLVGPACERFRSGMRARGLAAPSADLDAIAAMMARQTVTPAVLSSSGLGFSVANARR